MMADKLRKISRTYSDIHSLYDDADLKKAGLSLSDYRELLRLMPLLGKPGSAAYTIFERAASYFNEHGFSVSESGNGFLITI